MYETEEQQVEALKRWWKSNATSIIAGVVIGLGGVFGWRAWVQHRDDVAAQASNVFDQLAVSVETGNADSARQQSELLQREYGSTPYPAFAQLLLARLKYEQGDAAGAAKVLEEVVAHSPDPALKTVAVLRLVRIHLDAGELDAAGALLRQHPAPEAFGAEYAVLEGDLARARGDTAAAREAYQKAIAGGAGNADLIQLKLENLPSSPAS
jgi:predicted negative regulator of RcsB-dependent stress response